MICVLCDWCDLSGSVLHFAARKGRTAVCQLLLEQDPPADLNALTKNNWTPLMLAADRGHLDTCQLLLQRGADPFLISNVRESRAHHRTHAPASPHTSGRRSRLHMRLLTDGMMACFSVCAFRTSTRRCQWRRRAVTAKSLRCCPVWSPEPLLPPPPLPPSTCKSPRPPAPRKGHTSLHQCTAQPHTGDTCTHIHSQRQPLLVASPFRTFAVARRSCSRCLA